MMTEYQPVSLTYSEIQAIEARAHEMRTQAMADMMRALGRGLLALPLKIAALLHRTRAA
ncbi:RSP_7527 family protein [Pseudophaeobacter leonis]|uniref:RSP_7527 family protein n=1 Tax=Pseudophaeobacter leonis TaxID=1144477 RepID=UPI00137472F9|nr:hypothetical protein [Pseudophaeobacter leonis]